MQFLANILIIGILCPLLTSWLVNRLMQKQREVDNEQRETILMFITEQQNYVEEKIDGFTKLLTSIEDSNANSFTIIQSLVSEHIQQMTQNELAAGEDTVAMMNAFVQGQINTGIRPTVEMQKVIRQREDRNQVIRDRLASARK